MIFKYQQGGGFALPFVNYQPVVVSDKRTGMTQEQALASKATKDSESGKLTSKDLYTMLKDKLKGLPSDVDMAMDNLRQLQVAASMDFDGSLTQNIENIYLQTLGQMNNLTFSRERFDDAVKTVRSNGGYNEIAINEDGRIYMTNGKEYKMMTPEEAKKSGWTAVTNSDLLYLRANDNRMAGRDELLDVISNGIGTEQITKMIQNAIQGLGTNSNSEEAYATTPQGQLIQGLNDFMKAAQETGQYDSTVEDLYKGKVINKSQAEQAQMALSYIYRMLPNNAKSLLKYKTDSGTDKEAITLMSQLITSNLSSSRDFSMTLEGGPTKKSNSKDSSTEKDNTDLKTSLPLQIMNSVGEVRNAPITIDKGDGTQMSVTGAFYSAITDKSGETITNTSLQNMLAKSGLQDIVKDMRGITFGDQKLSPQQLANITYNNTGVVRANLPVKEDGTVNLEVLDDFNAAMNDIKLLGANPSQQAIRNIKAKYHLDQYIDDNGVCDIHHTAPFLITEGYTTEKNGIKDTPFVKRIDATDEQIQLIEDSLTTGTGNDKKVPKIDAASILPWDWFGMYDYVYKGAIYIPITNNVNAAVRGANQHLDYDESLNQELKFRNFEKMNKAKSTSADIL